MAHMSERWKTAILADVLTEVRERTRVERDAEYPLAGVYGFGRGVLLRDAVRGSDISAQFLYRIRSGQVMYSRLKAFEGAFALVPEEADGRFVSNEFPTFDVDSSLASGPFLRLLLTRRRVWQELESGSQGMGARRERLQADDFLDFEFDLPPLEQQERVVCAAQIAERALEASKRLATAARRAHIAARQELIEGTNYERVPLDELVAAVEGGKSPKCLNRPPAEDEYGVLKVSAIRDGQFRPHEAKALPAGVAPDAPSVRAGDLLYSRANTASLVGAMCRVERDHPHLLLCDKTMRVTLHDMVDPDFLVEAVGTTVAREYIEMMAGGTSESMKNISQPSFLATEVALPPLDEQRRIAAALWALRRAAVTTDDQRARLEGLREALTEDLVFGVREAPEMQLTA